MQLSGFTQSSLDYPTFSSYYYIGGRGYPRILRMNTWYVGLVGLVKKQVPLQCNNKQHHPQCQASYVNL
jgi:hypothetical protein